MVPALPASLFHQLRTVEHHVFSHRLRRDTGQFHRFHKTVTQVMIELLLYTPNLLHRLLRKGFRKVLSHHLPAITGPIVHRNKKQVGKNVQKA